MDMLNFTPEELLRYSRHFNLSQVGVTGQAKLKAAKVLCIGAGGLGSPLLLYLAAAGVGTIGIIDGDVVEASNLQRQILFTSQDIQRKKVVAAAEHLRQLNPHIQLVLFDELLTHDNALDIINQFDLVADGTDNFATRYLVNDACFHLKKPNVYASIFQFEGQCSIFNAQDGPCYRCLYDAPPPAGLIPNCAEGGVLGVLPGLLGTIQATEVIKYIIGAGDPLIGRLLLVNALTMQFQVLPVLRNPNCRLCTHQQAFDTLLPHHIQTCFKENQTMDEITVKELQQLMDQKTDFQLIDVREPHEYAICNLGGKLIPLAQLPLRLDELDELDKNQLIILHCKAGGRSMQALQLLKSAGFSNVKHVLGGVLAWAKEIDQEMTVY